MDFSSILDSHFRRNDNTKCPPVNLSVGRPLDGQGRGELFHSAKVLLLIFANRIDSPNPLFSGSLSVH